MMVLATVSRFYSLKAHGNSDIDGVLGQFITIINEFNLNKKILGGLKCHIVQMERI